jgi:hypothetical protein
VRGEFLIGTVGRLDEAQHAVAQPLGGGAPIALTSTQRQLGSIDFDGERVAYARQGCAVDDVVLDDLTTLRTQPPPATQRCRVALTVPRVIRLRGGRTFTVRVTCPDGCRPLDTWVDVTSPAGDVSLFSFPAPPGKEQALRIRLRGRPLRRLRRDGELRVTVEVGVAQPDGSRPASQRARVRLIR